MFYNFFSSDPISISLGLLVLRIGSSLLIMIHGWPRLLRLINGKFSFSDVFDFGSPSFLSLVVLSQYIFCIFVILGYKTRPAVVPLILTMVFLFLIHLKDPFPKKEIALLYLMPFVAIFFAGSGRYSIER